MADNDNETPLTQALRDTLARNQDDLASNLAEALRSTVEGNDMVVNATMGDASRNLRAIADTVNFLEKHNG